MNLPSDPSRTQVLALLQQHGWNATSFQVLEPGFRHWFGAGGCVAYVDVGSAWVAAGAPVAANERLGEVARGFVAAAREQGKAACFFGTEARFDAFPRICIGEQPVWDPRLWEQTLTSSKSLREQLRRARAKAVTVREVHAAELAPGTPLRADVETLVARWMAVRRMAPMGFLVDVELFGFATERRYFVAEREGALLGLLAAVPVYARRGWFLEDLLRAPEAPNGSAELLVDGAMRAFAATGSGYATLGLAPLAGDVPGILRTARTVGAVLYDFDGVRAFKAKLRPDRWDPIYLSYPSGSPRLALAAALRAFAGGGLLRFGMQSVLRGPPVIVRLLALLLIPWTLLLAAADASTWFPSPAVKLAWVLFDGLLCVALWSLASRWRSKLARLLATCISLDAVATLFEAWCFNVPRVHGLASALVVAAGVLAPLGAAGVLWGALRVRGGSLAPPT
jgi:phosphatidylglycerol lysyltransferase